MATKKKAAVRADKKTRHGLVARLVARDDEGHSPIIITDGSASIQFDFPYIHLGGGNHISAGIRLDSIEARRMPDGPIDHICHTFTGSTPHRIEAVCLIGHVRTDIIIEGAKTGTFRSPTIKFDRDGHFRKHAMFPTKPLTKGERFGNANARIISFRIINVNTERSVHDCPLIPAGGFEYIINDGHG